MNPQFLFSSLRAVSSLCTDDAPRAERLVEHLSTVLRQSMQRAGRALTSLDDEVQFVREYLDVEDARLGARLRLSWKIAPETLPRRVPTGCLRALVEDAIANGVEPRTAGAHLEIVSTLASTPIGERLQLSVEDYGPAAPDKRKEGDAVTDLRKRLYAEYAEAYSLDMTVTGTGVRMTLDIPGTLASEAQP